MKKFSVVISRQFGSLGRPIAKEMSEILGVEYYDRDIVTMVAKEHNITIREVSNLEEKSSRYAFMKFPLERLRRRIKSLTPRQGSSGSWRKRRAASSWDGARTRSSAIIRTM